MKRVVVKCVPLIEVPAEFPFVKNVRVITRKQLEKMFGKPNKK